MRARLYIYVNTTSGQALPRHFCEFMTPGRAVELQFVVALWCYLIMIKPSNSLSNTATIELRIPVAPLYLQASYARHNGLCINSIQVHPSGQVAFNLAICDLLS